MNAPRWWLVVVLAVAGCLPPRGGGDAGGAQDAAAAPDAAVASAPDAGGCVDFGRASSVCGFNSDGGVCVQVVRCGLSASETSCRNACETATRTHCYSEADLQCLVARAVAADCSGLANCGWAW